MGNDQEKRKAMDEWRKTLLQVNNIARKNRGYLLKEIQEIIRSAQIEVEEKLFSRKENELLGSDDFPESWQKILGVRNEEELYQSVGDYKNALKLSESLLENYKTNSL